MTIEELNDRLKGLWWGNELYVCHFAKRAGKAKPVIHPLAELRWIDGRLCLVEADDRKLYLADR